MIHVFIWAPEPRVVHLVLPRSKPALESGNVWSVKAWSTTGAPRVQKEGGSSDRRILDSCVYSTSAKAKREPQLSWRKSGHCDSPQAAVWGYISDDHHLVTTGSGGPGWIPSGLCDIGLTTSSTIILLHLSFASYWWTPHGYPSNRCTQGCCCCWIHTFTTVGH